MANENNIQLGFTADTTDAEQGIGRVETVAMWMHVTAFGRLRDRNKPKTGYFFKLNSHLKGNTYHLSKKQLRGKPKPHLPINERDSPVKMLKTIAHVALTVACTAASAELVNVRPGIDQSLVVVLDIQNKGSSEVTLDTVKLLLPIDGPGTSPVLVHLNPAASIAPGSTQTVRLASVQDVRKWLKSPEEKYPVLRVGNEPGCPEDMGNGNCLSHPLGMEVASHAGDLSERRLRGIFVYLIRPR